jgi:predicted extracellular nuclease
LEYYLTTNFGQGYGPNNETEAARQHTKIIAALLAIDADIYGLIEIEQGQDALIKIVNCAEWGNCCRKIFVHKDGGTIYGTYTKVGYIYRTDKISPYLDLKNKNSPSPHHRKKAQAFMLKSNNERFIFSVNHFKAKSGCSTATGSDVDQGDGQSCYNATRVAEAESTINFMNTCKTYYGDADVLIMGDLNAYAKEDPIRKFIDAGYVDLHRAFHADSSYSYVYRGEAGYLDHALANSTMRQQITGMQAFNINSDEHSMFEYSGSPYQPDMYRCSDHDPVVVEFCWAVQPI